MAGSKEKRMVGFYASEDEAERLAQIAKDRCITLSELLRRIADGDLLISEPPTASALKDQFLAKLERAWAKRGQPAKCGCDR